MYVQYGTVQLLHVVQSLLQHYDSIAPHKLRNPTNELINDFHSVNQPLLAHARCCRQLSSLRSDPLEQRELWQQLASTYIDVNL